MPEAQFNKRSGWVFLALAHIKPRDTWSKAKAPLLPTVDIMQFIREHYGQDYKPNSRETIRRGTLHQFEQARIADRNRDNPSRPTNSKDNNYSLNDPVLSVLRDYPKGNWKEKIEEYKKDLPRLKDIYAKKIDKKRVSIIFPDGKKLKLSPGKHNQLQADIIQEFCSRFIGGGGRLLYMGDTAGSRSEGGKFMVVEGDVLRSIGISQMSHGKLPDVVVMDERRGKLFLIEAVVSHGPISPKRQLELEEAFVNCEVERVYVTAFRKLSEFRKNAADIAWGTVVWTADNPDHIIHFNGDIYHGLNT